MRLKLIALFTLIVLFVGGLGYALKVLQAAVTLEGGFEEMRWTVDPLRAANARLEYLPP